MDTRMDSTVGWPYAYKHLLQYSVSSTDQAEFTLIAVWTAILDQL